MRLIFLGSGSFGLPTIKQLHHNHQLLAVVTAPDKPSGRKQRLTATPIGAWAQESGGTGVSEGGGLCVIKTGDVNKPDTVQTIAQMQPDAAVVIAFGQKLGPGLLEALGGLCVNLHASLLPKYRGAAPINWAMIHNEAQTGLSVISLAQRMDAGLIYAQRSTPINPLETVGELHDRLADMGPEAILDVLKQYESGTLKGQPQDDQSASRAPKLSKADGTVDFSLPAVQVRCRIHGLTPWPGVRVMWRQGSVDGTMRQTPLTLIRVKDEMGQTHNTEPGMVLEGHRVAAGRGVVQLLEVKIPGGRAMAMKDFTRGHAWTPGDRLSPYKTGS